MTRALRKKAFAQGMEVHGVIAPGGGILRVERVWIPRMGRDAGGNPVESEEEKEKKEEEEEEKEVVVGEEL